ncbi:MAG: hypothetical protein ACI9UK_001935 [Candidatus Krumholzibacteriia bacterium]|jgi:hypothetical protein
MNNSRKWKSGPMPVPSNSYAKEPSGIRSGNKRRNTFLIIQCVVIGVLLFLGGCKDDNPTQPPAPALLDGSIVIQPLPSELDAPWTLTDSKKSEVVGNGAQTLTDMAPGEYRIVWGSMQDMTTPLAASQTLASESEVTFTGTYELFGSIEVDAEPNSLNATWLLSGPGNYRYDGAGDVKLSGLDNGAYTLKWQSIPGFATPQNSTQTLLPDDIATFTGTYSEQQAAMTATVNGGTWTAVEAGAVLDDVGETGVIGMGLNPTNTAELMVVVLALPDWTVGEHLLTEENSNSVAGLIQSGSSDESMWIAGGGYGSGSIIVTSASSTHLQGTFSFVGLRFVGAANPAMADVTNGSFNVEYLDGSAAKSGTLKLFMTDNGLSGGLEQLFNSGPQ